MLGIEKITRLTTGFAITFSALIAFLIPFGYFTLSYNHLVGTLETEAEINSKLVSGLINANPELWRYESDRIEELLNRRPRAGNAETRRIFDGQGALVAESVNQLDPPLISASHAIYDSGHVDGKIVISRSLRPILYKSGIMAILGLMLGVLSFRIVPFRAVIRAGTLLQETNDFLKKVMEGSSNAIVVLDLTGSVQMANRRFEEISGFHAVDFSRRQFSSMFIGDAWTHISAAINTLKHSDDEKAVFETDLVRQDGVIIHLICGATPLVKDGSISGVVLTLEDITERKRIARDLQDKNSELERFTYTVSHDLKSPLITIQSFSGQVLKDYNEGKETYIREDLQRISDAASKMMHLLDDLLKLSRVGQKMNSPVTVEMGSVVDDVLSRLAGSLKLGQVKVSVQPELLTVKGDALRLAEALQNLLENAIKYMGSQPEPHIEIGLRQDGRKRVYFVRDNGVGIDPRHHDDIFELFRQLHEKSAGTGVGLALVKRIIELHGGKIWVESEGAGRGSCFCFTLPAPAETDPA